ncbi:hypothetical protein [Burkholderia cenocepacia]|uniref:hypothetical protein n=1 Tax=Burkholderia cenocepacia TaxID=95486 RepID=UPI00158EB085|nr:hypothetical protein [Burkholderia cenocepacia]
MSWLKSTPGPWHWDDTVWNYDPEQQAPWLVAANDDWVLCGEIKCNEANARLIAASPDMADILEIIAADADAGKVMIPSGLRLSIDAALIKAGRKAAPEPVRHITVAGGAL